MAGRPSQTVWTKSNYGSHGINIPAVWQVTAPLFSPQRRNGTESAPAAPTQYGPGPPPTRGIETYAEGVKKAGGVWGGDQHDWAGRPTSQCSILLRVGTPRWALTLALIAIMETPCFCYVSVNTASFVGDKRR